RRRFARRTLILHERPRAGAPLRLAAVHAEGKESALPDLRPAAVVNLPPLLHQPALSPACAPPDAPAAQGLVAGRARAALPAAAAVGHSLRGLRHSLHRPAAPHAAAAAAGISRRHPAVRAVPADARQRPGTPALDPTVAGGLR